MVEQGAVTFLDLIHFEKKAVEVFESVDLDLAQAFDFFGLATMMRERMPASGGPGHRNGSVDPVHGEGDDPGGVGPESEFGELEEIVDLGREREFRVFA